MAIPRFFLTMTFFTCLLPCAVRGAGGLGGPSDGGRDWLGNSSNHHRVIAQRWWRPRRGAARPTFNNTLASGIDRENFDPSARFQDDLYRAVNGTWLNKTEIPADRADYGAFTALIDKAEADLHKIIDECAAAKDNPPGSERQKVGDLYTSYMDEDRIENLGMAPVLPRLAAVDAIKTKEDLARTLAELNKLGVGGPFMCGVTTDAKHSDQHILGLGQAGLGLPDRDYYLDPKFKSKLEAYQVYLEKLLALAKVENAHLAAREGERHAEHDEYVKAAADIVALEAQIAKIQWSKVENRDAEKTYNKMSIDALVELAPGFDWKLYFKEIGARDAKEVDVGQPPFFTAIAKMLDTVPLETWKTWLKYHVVHRYAGLLGKDFADTEFAFFGTTLRGVPQNRPRWKRGVMAVEGSLGEAAGKLYVEKHFPPQAKQRMDEMVKNVMAAYRTSIQNADWLSAATKERALAKLSAFTPKIGYPKKWRDYSPLEIRRDDLVGNMERAATYEWNRDINKLGKPVDREEWHMTPQTVNAYYNPAQNEIVFPAAILQPPFFNMQADDAVNYGGIGAVIGHETGHGFDDQGSKWDGAGNLNQWWTPADRAEFDKRGDALAQQYGQFEPFPGFKVNGRLTLGENLADLAGLTIALRAYHLSLGGKPAPVMDGLTGDQRFFVGWAQVWRRKHREADLKNRLVTDPHSPSEYRANGTARNVPAFYEAFGVKPGDKMWLAPEKRVRIW
jgi:putative endopeptidase